MSRSAGALSLGISGVDARARSAEAAFLACSRRAGELLDSGVHVMSADSLRVFRDAQGFTVGVTGESSDESLDRCRLTARRRREDHDAFIASAARLYGGRGDSIDLVLVRSRPEFFDGFYWSNNRRQRRASDQKSVGVARRQRRWLLAHASAFETDAHYVVLTVGDSFAEDPAVWSRWMRRLYVAIDARLGRGRGRFAGSVGVDWCAVWLLAAQGRDAPHWDLLMRLPGLSDSETAEFFGWLSDTWISISGLGGSDPVYRRAHGLHWQPVPDVGGVLGYVLRHHLKLEQARFSGGSKPVQWWGKWHSARLAEFASQGEPVALDEHRLMTLALVIGLDPVLVQRPRSVVHSWSWPDFWACEPSGDPALVWQLASTWFGVGAQYLATGDAGPLIQHLAGRAER